MRRTQILQKGQKQKFLKKVGLTRCAAPADAMAQQVFLLPYGDIMRRNPASCKGGLSAQQ